MTRHPVPLSNEEAWYSSLKDAAADRFSATAEKKMYR